MMLRFVLALFVGATPYFAEAKEKHLDPNRATLGNCLAAIEIASRNMPKSQGVIL